MRRDSKENMLMVTGMVVLILSAAAVSYMVASYQNTLKMKEVQVIYEYKIESISTQAEKFGDNLSKALTYLDIARYNLERARLNLDKSLFWMEEKEYAEMNTSSSNAVYYFRRANTIFGKALDYLLISMNFTVENYEKVLEYYINYTNSALNLTKTGELMSMHLNNASYYLLSGAADNADAELQKFSTLQNVYSEWDQDMENNLIKIKTFYGIRE
ncbi:MAG: hypothetical protein FE037_01175 [Thermoplasmata archaeon]|nr:MAG: hypothetical protein FE042_00700 [Thermoplasmata archaeon]KAA0016800.1 MAG: hypothetical protein FE037_01175 [Thermoplasmata archaeon]